MTDMHLYKELEEEKVWEKLTEKRTSQEVRGKIDPKSIKGIS